MDDQKFFENSNLQIVIPENTQAKISDLFLQVPDAEVGPDVPLGVKQRPLLYFGTHVPHWYSSSGLTYSQARIR